MILTKNIYNTFFSLSLSIFVHLLFLFSFCLYVQVKHTPIINSWPDIIKRDDLFNINKYNNIHLEGFIIDKNYPKEYFFSLFSQKNYFLIEKKEKNYAKSILTKREIKEYNRKNEFFYLWDKPIISLLEDDIKVSFKMFVSGYGRIILSFPEKLLVNSSQNILLQDYFKESIFFTKDKFFWTKLEHIVK